MREMTRNRLPLSGWTVGHTTTPTAVPNKFVPSEVPGAVQLDWAKAEGWAPHWKADNFKQYGWMEDVYWLYRVSLPSSQVDVGRRRMLVLRGVDYQFEVRINGVAVFQQEGMFKPVEIDVTSNLGANLEILVWPAPKYSKAHRPKAEASRSCKPSVSYGWDWHPRLIPLGIWDDAFLEDRSASFLEKAAVHYTLNDDLTSASLHLETVVSAPQPGQSLRFTLNGANGKTVATVSGSQKLSALLSNPQLWWPNGQGEAYLYSSLVELLDASGTVIDAHAAKIGFRRARLVMNEGAWEEPAAFPKSRSVPPITLEINGRRIFAKGSNWVNPDIFPGTITAETYRPLIQMAKDAHFNIFRTWGGAIVNKASFFEQCDAAGIMVWQEFPLACNDYADDPNYLRVLDQESRAIIERLAQHPSVCLWCGGNELFNVWSGMTDQHKALRLLNRNCYDLDPETPFLPTSPVMGMGHGDYRFRDEKGREVYQMFAQARNTAYTEFGCPGPSDADYIASFTPPEELFPPAPGGTWEHHHAFGAWGVAPSSWLFPELIAEYFGEMTSLEQLVSYGQLMQAEGYKCLYEEARRQKPFASMALNWCYNEPWPSAANNSLINWPARAKPAFHAVAQSCRPVLASARLPQFSWIAEDLFKAELWLLNDSPSPVPAGRMKCVLCMDGKEVPLVTWDFPETPANQNLAGPVARALLPVGQANVFEVVVRVEGRPELDSTYRLCFHPGQQRGKVRVGFVNNA
jgi:beta-mannosidase